MSAHVLLLLAVNSKSEQKVNSLPTLRFELGFEPVIFGMLTHFSDHLAKSQPQSTKDILFQCMYETHFSPQLAYKYTCPWQAGRFWPIYPQMSHTTITETSIDAASPQGKTEHETSIGKWDKPTWRLFQTLSVFTRMSKHTVTTQH
jgi:hypothetical protein